MRTKAYKKFIEEGQPFFLEDQGVEEGDIFYSAGEYIILCTYVDESFHYFAFGDGVLSRWKCISINVDLRLMFFGLEKIGKL